MALCGVPDRVIRGYGRWKSYAYRIYIDLTHKEKLQWQALIGEKIKSEAQARRSLSHALDEGNETLRRLING